MHLWSCKCYRQHSSGVLLGVTLFPCLIIHSKEKFISYSSFYSFFGLPLVCTLRWDKRGMCIESYNSELIYLQVYWLWIKYVHECYLAEPAVRCSSHTSQSSIYLLMGKWWAFSLVRSQEQHTLIQAVRPFQDTQEQADWLWALTYIIRLRWCQWNR